MRALVVEDGPAIDVAVAQGPGDAGFIVDRVADGEQVWFAGRIARSSCSILAFISPRPKAG